MEYSNQFPNKEKVNNYSIPINQRVKLLMLEIIKNKDKSDLYNLITKKDEQFREI